MPWMKIDDSFESHPKVKSIPKGKRTKAIGLWTLAGSWCARHLTDGFVPSYMVGELGGTKAESSLLVAASLWHEVGDGFTFHDWTDHQPTRAKVEEEREAAKERMRVARERKKGTSSGNVRANDSATPPNGSGEVRSTPRSVTPTRPDPTRPDPKEETPRAVALVEPDRFDEFWAAYDKRRGRKNAEAKYRLALKKPGVTADLLIAAAASYVEWQRQEGKHPQFTKDPATWLNGEHWTDERVARAQPQTRVQEHLTLVQQLAAEEAAQPTLPQIGYSR